MTRPDGGHDAAGAPGDRSPLPLDGVKVLELGRFMAAPWCGQLLGDLGAEVTKVERSGTGDQFREYGPFFLKDAEGRDTAESSYFLSANRNKRSIVADFSDPGDCARIRSLARDSDVLLENFKAGDLARFGLDYQSLSREHPGLVYCSITGFGQEGPYAGRPALDSVFQAMSGLMSVTGEPDGMPQKVGVVIIDQVAGLYAAVAILAALRHREVNGGSGQHIDLALLDSAIAMMSHRAQDYLLSGDVPRRFGSATVGATPAQIFRCADGMINIQASDTPAFRSLCGVLGKPHLADDPRFRTRSSRWHARDELLPILQAALLGFTVKQLFDMLAEAQIICAPIYDFSQTLEDAHVLSRGVLWEMDHALGPVRAVANPIRFSKTPLTRRKAPPTLGQDG